MKVRDSSGLTNYLVPLSSGVLRPPHVKQIGPALALFARLEDMVTRGDGSDGQVHGGKPVLDRELAQDLGLHPKTIAEHRLRLTRYGYIEAKRTPHGYSIRVKKSKKWVLLQQRRSAQASSLLREPSGSITPKVMELIPTVIEPIGSTDGAKPLDVDQTVVGLREDVVRSAGAPLTPQPDQMAAWRAIGTGQLGTPLFQVKWGFFFDHKHGEALSDAMERCIQVCLAGKVSVPKPFYRAKRLVEAREEEERKRTALVDDTLQLEAIPWRNKN